MRRVSGPSAWSRLDEVQVISTARTTRTTCGLERDARKAVRAVFGYWRCRGRWLRAEPVDLPDEQEDDKGHEGEVDEGIEEDILVDRGGPGCLCLGQRGYFTPVRLTNRLAKLTRPCSSPMGGMMTSFTSEVTILPNAPPRMKPKAKGSALPRIANALNSIDRAVLQMSWARGRDPDWAEITGLPARLGKIIGPNHRRQAVRALCRLGSIWKATEKSLRPAEYNGADPLAGCSHGQSRILNHQCSPL